MFGTACRTVRCKGLRQGEREGPDSEHGARMTGSVDQVGAAESKRCGPCALRGRRSPMSEMRVVGVRVELPANQPILLLRETDGERDLAIWIGSGGGTRGA